VTVPAVVGAVHNRATGVAEVIPEKATAVAPVENVVVTPEFDPYAVAVATVPAAEFVPGAAATATVVAALASSERTPPAPPVAICAFPDVVSFKNNPTDLASSCPDELETPEWDTAVVANLVATNNEAPDVPLSAEILTVSRAPCEFATGMEIIESIPISKDATVTRAIELTRFAL